MTDEQTRAYETPATDPAPPDPAPPPPAAPETAPAPTAPVPAASGGRMRWILGLGAAAVVIALTVGAFMLLNGGASTPEALRYVPADSAMVIEARFDLPGDQLQKLGNLLAHFPGFADQSTLDQKIDEALSRLVNEASGGNADYASEIKPWLNGPLFISGDARSLSEAQGAGETQRFLLSATTNTAVACPTTFDNEPVAHEAYNGLDLTTVQDGAFACVVDGRIGLLGDSASVKEAIDTKRAGSGLDKSGTYAAARKTLTGDQLAAVYLSGAAVRQAMPSMDPGSVPVPGLDAFTGQIPEWFILGVRAEDDALVVDGVAAPVPPAADGPSLLPNTPAHASVIAPQVPAGTLVYLEDQGTGVSLQNLFAQLRSVPDLQEPLQMLDGVGGPAGIVGWVEDAGIALSAKDPTVENPNIQASVYLVARDDAAAAEKLSTVRSFLALAGMSGEGVTVTTEPISGVEVTTVTITDLGSVVPPGSVPGVDPGAIYAPISFSLAAKGRTIIVTVGDGAMAEVLAVGAGSSLADDPAFKLAAQRGLQTSKTTVYAAVGATVDMVRPLLPAEMLAEWDSELAPYVAPLEALGVSISTDAAANRSRLVLTVSNP